MDQDTTKPEDERAHIGDPVARSAMRKRGGRLDYDLLQSCESSSSRILFVPDLSPAATIPNHDSSRGARGG